MKNTATPNPQTSTDGKPSYSASLRGKRERGPKQKRTIAAYEVVK
jgi:hypothetical protein